MSLQIPLPLPVLTPAAVRALEGIAAGQGHLPMLPPLPVFPEFSPWFPIDRAPWEGGFYEVRDIEGVIYSDRPRWMPPREVQREIVFKGESTPMASTWKPGYWLHMPANAVAWRGLARPAAV